MFKQTLFQKLKMIFLGGILIGLLGLPAAGPAAASSTAANPLYLPMVVKSGNPIHQGIATYYVEANGDGNCMFGPSPNDLMVAAINWEEYAGSAACGSYVEVHGPKGSVTVRIVDSCPGCQKGHLDLSPDAFAKIADLVAGRVNITWQVISPNIPGPIAYHFKDGTNPWWTAVQIRNHRNPIATVEYKNSSGQWINLPRTDYNYFIRQGQEYNGPFSFRVTDIYGHVLIDNNIPLVENGTFNGATQFPYGP